MMSSPPRHIPAKRARHTLRTLFFASAVCTSMLLVRFAFSGTLHFSGLFGNLLLAWIPLALAFYLWRMPSGDSRLRFCSALALWILFFPNAFYIVTDFIHEKKFGRDGVYRWFDLLMTAGFACGGMFLGCLSLYLLHLFVRQRYGWRTGWLFAGGMLALGSFGIFLGRSLRLNSWDVITRPFKLISKIAGLLEPMSAREAGAFTLAFFFFSLAVYGFIVSMARLHEGEATEKAAPDIL